jgi:hypothetical protein
LQRIAFLEETYGQLCNELKDVTVADEYNNSHNSWDARMDWLNKGFAYGNHLNDFVAEAKIAYSSVPRWEKRRSMLRMIQTYGYLPELKDFFFLGLTDEDLAPYIAVEKSTAAPIKLPSNR